MDGLLLPTLILTNGLATAVKIAHNLNGLAKIPWIAHMSPNNLNGLATANSTVQSEGTRLVGTCVNIVAGAPSFSHPDQQWLCEDHFAAAILSKRCTYNQDVFSSHMA